MKRSNYVSAVLRIIVALISLFTVYNLLHVGGAHELIKFTLQSNFMLAVSFIWVAWSLLARRQTPPEWLAGSAVFYLVVTGVVSNFVIGPAPRGSSPEIIFGLTNSDLEHIVTPLAALLIWIVFEEHRRIPWRYIGIWLLYLVAYLTVVLALVTFGDSVDAPYPFLDVETLGWAGVLGQLAIFMAGFCAIAAVLITLDHVLPAGTRWSEYDPFDQPRKRTAAARVKAKA